MTQIEAQAIQEAAKMEIYVWVLSGVLTFVIGITIMILTASVKGITQKINDLIESMERLNISNAQLIEKSNTLFSSKAETDRRLNDHADRLRLLEINCGKSTSCHS